MKIIKYFDTVNALDEWRYRSIPITQICNIIRFVFESCNAILRTYSITENRFRSGIDFFTRLGEEIVQTYDGATADGKCINIPSRCSTFVSAMMLCFTENGITCYRITDYITDRIDQKHRGDSKEDLKRMMDSGKYRLGMTYSEIAARGDIHGSMKIKFTVTFDLRFVPLNYKFDEFVHRLVEYYPYLPNTHYCTEDPNVYDIADNEYDFIPLMNLADVDYVNDSIEIWLSEAEAAHTTENHCAAKAADLSQFSFVRGVNP